MKQTACVLLCCCAVSAANGDSPGSETISVIDLPPYEYFEAGATFSVSSVAMLMGDCVLVRGYRARRQSSTDKEYLEGFVSIDLSTAGGAAVSSYAAPSGKTPAAALYCDSHTKCVSGYERSVVKPRATEQPLLASDVITLVTQTEGMRKVGRSSLFLAASSVDKAQALTAKLLKRIHECSVPGVTTETNAAVHE